MDVLGRYRNLIVLVGVLFLQVLGLAVQVKRTTDGESTHLIRIWAVDAVTPLEKALNWVRSSTGNIWHNYFYLRGVRAENRELKQEIERMRIEQVRISQDADQARRLQALLAFKEQFISRTMAAQVIGSSGSEQSHSVYIDKGEHDGIKPDMAVITEDGVVGKVLNVFGSTSLVLLIDDPSSGVGVILESSRLQGILRGTASGVVQLEKVMSDETVPVGEQVLTSGGDTIFPKGLPVGKVTKVTKGSDLFLNISVRPAANLGRLEEVLVVTKIDERQAAPLQATPQRAVDILAERLPTVPAKVDAAPEGSAKAPVAANGVATIPSPGQPPQNQAKQKPATSAGTANSPVASSVAPANASQNITKTKPTTASNSAASTVSTSPTPAIKKTPGSTDTSVSGPPAGTTGAATAVKKPAPKPVSTATTPAVQTVAPKPKPAAQDTPQ